MQGVFVVSVGEPGYVRGSEAEEDRQTLPDRCWGIEVEDACESKDDTGQWELIAIAGSEHRMSGLRSLQSSSHRSLLDTYMHMHLILDLKPILISDHKQFLSNSGPRRFLSALMQSPHRVYGHASSSVGIWL